MTKQTKTEAVVAPLLLSVAATRTRLGGVSDTAVRALVRRGELDGRRLGRRLLITAASTERFAARLPRAAAQEVGQ